MHTNARMRTIADASTHRRAYKQAHISQAGIQTGARIHARRNIRAHAFVYKHTSTCLQTNTHTNTHTRQQSQHRYARTYKQGLAANDASLSIFGHNLL